MNFRWIEISAKGTTGKHSMPCGIVEPLIIFFLFRCIGGGEGLWIDPPPLLDPRFRRVPLELSCVKFEFRIMFILRCFLLAVLEGHAVWYFG